MFPTYRFIVNVSICGNDRSMMVAPLAHTVQFMMQYKADIHLLSTCCPLLIVVVLLLFIAFKLNETKNFYFYPEMATYISSTSSIFIFSSIHSETASRLRMCLSVLRWNGLCVCVGPSRPFDIELSLTVSLFHPLLFSIILHSENSEYCCRSLSRQLCVYV